MPTLELDNKFISERFAELTRDIEVPGGVETILQSDRRFDLAGRAFDDLLPAGDIVIMGYTSQGPAHANNIRTSLGLAGIDRRVLVALRPGSENAEQARIDGFTERNGTLVTPQQGLAQAAFLGMLIADGSMVHQGPEYLSLMKEGSVLGLAHGFYPGYLEGKGQRIQNIAHHLGGVVGLCPKAMGQSVRARYEAGDGSNASFAVEMGDTGTMTDVALAWGVLLGSPYIFKTTLGKEWRSDLVGERAALLGGIDGLVHAVYQWKRNKGVDGEQAYVESVESLVGPLTNVIAAKGLTGAYEAMRSDSERDEFTTAYNATYPVLKALTKKIYQDVSSGREIQEVYEDYSSGVPKPQIGGDPMWREGEKVRPGVQDGTTKVDIDPTVAGMYTAMMMAQVDILRDEGHHWSEVVNESIIEAVRSLNPYMKAGGIEKLVDNCSDTAQRGSRKWSGQFEQWITQAVLPVVDGGRLKDTRKAGMLLHDDTNYFGQFLGHDVHAAFNEFAKMWPDTDFEVA